jgi:putative addiction module CopG family antidote
MTIQLPSDLEDFVRSLVRGGRYASEDEVVAEAVRSLRRREAPSAAPGAGSIGSMRDAADELDEIVADAMRRRREETWRPLPGE